MTREDFIDASVATLRRAFEVSSEFGGGTVGYSEATVLLGDEGCPHADWSALSYTTTIDARLVPEELRGTHERVAVIWTLGGRSFIVFIDADAPAVDAAPWTVGRLPDNAIAVAAPGADPGAITALVAQIKAGSPALAVDWLDGVGILSVDAAIGTFTYDEVDGTTARDVEAAVELVRGSGLFTSIEWSALNFRLPNEFFPEAEVDDPLLSAECLREHTRALRDTYQLSTTPALAPPLGPGPTPATMVCP